MSDLMSTTGASRSTIRRDIEQMDRDGLLIRTHGGAKKIEHARADDIPLIVRQKMHSNEKQQIAKAALELIEPGDTIFLNAGTTTLELASMLDKFDDLTIITYDLLIALKIAPTQNRLIVAGGELRKGSVTLADTHTIALLNQYFVKKAFVSADAIDIDRGYMDYNPYEISIKRKMIENAQTSVMLLDHTKFEARAFAHICAIDAVTSILTDSSLPVETLDKYTKRGISITLSDGR